MNNVMDMVGVGQNAELAGIVIFCILSGCCLVQTVCGVIKRKLSHFVGQLCFKRTEEIR